MYSVYSSYKSDTYKFSESFLLERWILNWCASKDIIGPVLLVLNGGLQNTLCVSYSDLSRRPPKRYKLRRWVQSPNLYVNCKYSHTMTNFYLPTIYDHANYPSESL